MVIGFEKNVSDNLVMSVGTFLLDMFDFSNGFIYDDLPALMNISFLSILFFRFPIEDRFLRSSPPAIFYSYEFW
jgi:hypothetical protein